MKIPEVILIEVEHAPGNLAKVLAAVGEAGLTVEGLEAVRRTQDRTTWELTFNVDEDDTINVGARIDALPIASVLGRSDRVFQMHEGGKIEMVSTVAFDTPAGLRDLYTPGVARVCLAIRDDRTLARRYTNIQNTVAIVTNGTAILGLGDIGPVAGMPVMEGKAALFHAFAGISGVPILIESKDPRVIIETTAAIAPSFGAIQLEDIASPECFEIERELIERLPIPVLHDDQHGTAVVTLGAILSASRITGVDLSTSVVGQIGLGAAGIGITRLLSKYGVKRVLGADLDEDSLARLEANGGERSTLPDLMRTCDIVVATTGVKGLIKPEMIREGQMILALSNPEPEIEPHDALTHGAAFAADGKNINNVLGFPGLFRGVLDAGATGFTDAMLFAAAESLANQAPPGQLIPSPLDRQVHDRVAQAVERAAS
ncbi:MAG: NAD-dependent malic enzyme [Phycisphaeraceae bacterium]|nr:MAG: NAD-dependent malic enzyme [Phycisphaeraceae bacterium]